MSNNGEIIDQLQSSDITLKKKAIFAAGEKKIEEAVPILISLLENDENSVVRNSAARALGKIKIDSSRDIIIEALLNAVDDPDYYVKTNICWSLGKIGDPRGIPGLIKLANPNQRFYSTAGDGKTAESITEDQASDKLKEEGVKFSDVIVEAIKALGKIKDPSAVPALIEALGDEKDGNVRCAACLALGKVKDRSAVPALIDLLQREKYWYVRRDAIIALKKIKDPRAADELVKKTHDMYDEVSRYALDALLTIGKPILPKILEVWADDPENSKIQNFISNSVTPEEAQEAIQELIEGETGEALQKKYQSLLEAI